MRLLPEDRTARARIRDEALRLFAERGPDTVTMREVAAAAGVSAALVVRHYGSKDGLREAVDADVTRTFEAMLAHVARPVDSAPFDAAALPGLAEIVAGYLPPGSPLVAYLGRMFLSGGPSGTALFRQLYSASRNALAGLTEAGHAAAGADPELRAAFLLVNDLAVMILRDHLSDVLGVDPLSAAGMRRWGAEVITIYRDGLTGTGIDQQ